MSEWDFQENQLNMGSIQAEQVIFCEGPRMVENPPFGPRLSTIWLREKF